MVHANHFDWNPNSDRKPPLNHTLFTKFFLFSESKLVGTKKLLIMPQFMLKFYDSLDRIEALFNPMFIHNEYSFLFPFPFHRIHYK
jgi:hypothetical protein